MSISENKSSALIIIGNEILSGRTQDKNIQVVAEAMAAHGVPLAEVRVVPDVEDKIVETINTLRSEFDYVFTTGGIGPTHDDITAASVAKAFGVEFGRHQGAYDVLLDFYGTEKLTEARASMADMPVHQDIDLIRNPVSAAPGFRIENVFVMAGVPSIMKAMLDHVVEMITSGAPMLSRTIMVNSPESEVAAVLGQAQEKHTEIDIGSYPQYKDGHWGVSVVLRGVDEDALKVAGDALLDEIQKSGVDAQFLKA